MAHFAIPSHILVGKDALPSAVPYLKTYGNRAFIVTGKHVGKSPMMEQLKAAGKEKTATYRQYFGNRLFYKLMLEKYRKYGLLK